MEEDINDVIRMLGGRNGMSKSSYGELALKYFRKKLESDGALKVMLDLA